MTSTPATPLALLRALVQSDPGRPLITYYDEASRVELSRLTTANWVAKTANFFTDIVGLGPGSRAALLLPTHWRTPLVMMGAWAAGVCTRFGLEGGHADALVVAEDQLPKLPASDAQIIGVSLAHMGTGVSLAPVGAAGWTGSEGVVDYATEVLAAGDAFSADAAPEWVVHETPEQRWTAGELAAAAIASAGVGRVLCASRLDERAGLVDGLLAGLGGAGVVLCNGLPRLRLAAIAASERVARVVGAEL
ncbi:MAG: TIGR03089 family protein [Mycobacteriales bacterium]